MLQEYFSEISNPRQQVKVKYNLLEIVVITISAAISGCEGWEDTYDYCYVKEEWFRNSLGIKLEHGMQTYSSYERESNEKQNGMLRCRYPKGTNFK